ncbi:MAG: TRAP transporter small permease subunit, partial [Gammaproteobacteria bacterium]|nr:TRAP transporter small permease subunit [Gammaproteobacteria bacterium]
DVFYRRMSPPQRCLVNIVGTLGLLLPVCGLMTWSAMRYAARSWGYAERSAESGGLGYPFVPLGKSLIVVMLLLLIVQGIVILIRNWHGLRTGEFPEGATTEQKL